MHRYICVYVLMIAGFRACGGRKSEKRSRRKKRRGKKGKRSERKKRKKRGGGMKKRREGR